MKVYMKAIVDAYEFGNEKTHGSLMAYSDTPVLLMPIDDGVDARHIKNLIDSVDLNDAPTRLDRALRYKREFSFYIFLTKNSRSFNKNKKHFN